MAKNKEQTATVLVTDHAAKRIRERLGLNKKSIQRNAQTAWYKGMRREEAGSRLRKYLDGMFFEEMRLSGGKNKLDLRVHGEYVYLFDRWQDNNWGLITLWKLPGNLRKLYNAQRKKQ